MPKHGKRSRAELREGRPRAPVPAGETPSSCSRTFKTANFPETVEVHIRTELDTSTTPSIARARSRCPNGLGKEMTVAVFAKGDKAREAEEAGADHVGAEDLAERVGGGGSPTSTWRSPRRT